MIPDDLKMFRPSEEETPAVVRIMDATAFVAAAGLGWAVWVVAIAILGLA